MDITGTVGLILAFPLALARKLAQSPMVVVAVARLLLTTAVLLQIGRSTGSIASVLPWLALLWNLFGASSVLASGRLGAWFRFAVFVVDFAVCISLLSLFPGTLALPAMICLLLVGWAAYQRLGGGPVAVIAIAVIAAMLVRHRYAYLGDALQFSLNRAEIDAATVLLGGLATIAGIGWHLRTAQLRRWADAVQALGGNMLTLPLEQILTEVADIFSARQVVIVWRDAGDETVHLMMIEGGTTAPLTLPADTTDRLLHTDLPDTAWLYSSASDRVLLRSRLGALQFVPAARLIGDLSDVMRGRQGCSLPIAAGSFQGRIYSACGHDWSAWMLDDTHKVGDAIEGALERHFLMSAWRDRAYVEARHSLSRDLHDSVLQTFAALKMRVDLVQRMDDSGFLANARGELDGIHGMLTSEQQHLRQLLDASKRQALASESLQVALDRCAALISGQWSIDCRVVLNCPDFLVSRATTIEVEFLFREIVANAVQHAGAEQVTLSVDRAGDELMLAFRDDSSAVRLTAPDPAGGDTVRSRSISRRLNSLGASAYTDSFSRSVLLSIRIPLRRDALENA